MRVQIGPAIAYAGDGQQKAHERIPGEGAYNLSTGVRGHHEYCGRLNLERLFAPDLALQGHAGVKLFQRVATADYHWRVHGVAPRRFSRCFATSQNFSISSRGTLANSLPPSRAMASIARNREENFPLARLRAISGSIFRKRARFTAAKSRSPISSSSCARLSDANALAISALSSR